MAAPSIADDAGVDEDGVGGLDPHIQPNLGVDQHQRQLELEARLYIGGSSFTANPYVPPFLGDQREPALGLRRRAGLGPGRQERPQRSTSSARLALSAALTPNASKASSCVPRVPSASATAADHRPRRPFASSATDDAIGSMAAVGSFLLGIRVVLAAVFAVAGVAKLLDQPGTRRSLSDFGVPEPDPAGRGAAAAAGRAGDGGRL